MVCKASFESSRYSIRWSVGYDDTLFLHCRLIHVEHSRAEIHVHELYLGSELGSCGERVVFTTL
jgi:hypothetical protein